MRPTKPLRAIVCEGKDDLAVFRALLKVEEAQKKASRGMPPGLSKVERFETERVEITLEARDGKTDLVQLGLDAASGTAGVRPDVVLVSFDPDDDSPARAHGYKRAFRIWTAALAPDSESFAARLFQLHQTSSACLEAVRATPAWSALRVLLES